MAEVNLLWMSDTWASLDFLQLVISLCFFRGAAVSYVILVGFRTLASAGGVVRSPKVDDAPAGKKDLSNCSRENRNSFCFGCLRTPSHQYVLRSEGNSMGPRLKSGNMNLVQVPKTKEFGLCLTT